MKKTAKQEQLHIRLTAEEKDHINRYAREYDMSTSQYVIEMAVHPESHYNNPLICKIERLQCINSIQNRLLILPELSPKSRNNIMEVFKDVVEKYYPQSKE